MSVLYFVCVESLELGGIKALEQEEKVKFFDQGRSITLRTKDEEFLVQKYPFLKDLIWKDSMEEFISQFFLDLASWYFDHGERIDSSEVAPFVLKILSEPEIETTFFENESEQVDVYLQEIIQKALNEAVTERIVQYILGFKKEKDVQINWNYVKSVI